MDEIDEVSTHDATTLKKNMTIYTMKMMTLLRKFVKRIISIKMWKNIRTGQLSVYSLLRYRVGCDEMLNTKRQSQEFRNRLHGLYMLICSMGTTGAQVADLRCDARGPDGGPVSGMTGRKWRTVLDWPQTSRPRVALLNVTHWCFQMLQL